LICRAGEKRSSFCVCAPLSGAAGNPPQRQALKSPAIDPFCGNARAAATHTIQPRHQIEIYGTARKSFSRAVHEFRDFKRRVVISY
jgi:hypothetical protein